PGTGQRDGRTDRGGQHPGAWHRLPGRVAAAAGLASTGAGAAGQRTGAPQPRTGPAAGRGRRHRGRGDVQPAARARPLRGARAQCAGRAGRRDRGPLRPGPAGPGPARHERPGPGPAAARAGLPPAAAGGDRAHRRRGRADGAGSGLRRIPAQAGDRRHPGRGDRLGAAGGTVRVKPRFRRWPALVLATLLAGPATGLAQGPAPSPAPTPAALLQQTRVLYPLEVDGWRAMSEERFDDARFGVAVRYRNGERWLDLFVYPAGPAAAAQLHRIAEAERTNILEAAAQSGRRTEPGPLQAIVLP